MQYRVRIKNTKLYALKGAHIGRNGFAEEGDLYSTLVGARSAIRHHREVCQKFNIEPQDLEVVEAIILDGEIIL